MKISKVLVTGAVATLAAVLLTGCVGKTVKVESLDTKTYHIDNICIVQNDKVIVLDFIPIIRKGFKRHGISSKVYYEDVPKTCEYVFTYRATQAWDLKVFLESARLYINKDNTVIASASYDSGGGLQTSKFGTHESKLDPVIDKLLFLYLGRELHH